jgi:hypothetical protein
VGLLSRKSPEQRFWDWFQRNQRRLLRSDPRDPLWVRDLSAHLKRVHPDLTWEASADTEPVRELIISANGMLSAFAAVDSLVDAAPPLPQWTIVRFRPRVPAYAGSKLEYEGILVRGDDIECVLTCEEQGLGLRIYIRGCPTAHDLQFAGAAFIHLDSALGEYDVGCKLGPISVLPFEDDADEPNRFPFSELRERFDQEFDRRFAQGA